MSQGGGQWRVGGALGGHYTDGSPQPLTNLDLVPGHVIIVMINTISDWILKAYFQVHIEANNFLFWNNDAIAILGKSKIRSLGTDFMIIDELGRCKAIIVSLGEN